MHRNEREGSTLHPAASDPGSAAPTPLFLGFLGALVLAGLGAFRGGFSLGAATDFLLLAAVVTGSVVVAFAITMIWTTRAGQRAARLAAARPGAIVARGVRTRGLVRAMRSLRSEVPVVPLGHTLVADDSGLEVWSGSAEHPLRLGRAPWETVDDIRITRIVRWGRTSGGILLIVDAGVDAPIELPFAVTGAGLGGLFAPSLAELEELVAALRARRAAALAHA